MGDAPDTKIVIGICAMEAKTNSKAMKAILQRLESTNKFKIVNFGNHTMLHKPVSEWPLCDCLIGFHSSDFPMDKACQYAELYRHRMFIVNDFASQRLLLDRRLVYAILNLHSIPTPDHVVVSRDGLPSIPENEANPAGIPVIEESTDQIIVNGKVLTKPFVEKPVDGEDHNIYVYYHSKDGGGSRRLFRKIKNQSSVAYPNCNTIRRSDTESYWYEQFVTTNIEPDSESDSSTTQKDLKIYTVGQHYAHAEARKSPEVDGMVERHPDGREVRQLVELTELEQRIASTIVRCFRQRVCGFDVLRAGTQRSFVCDVNGWSFVKGNNQYYDSCGQILTKMFESQVEKMRSYPKESVPLGPQWKLRGLVSVVRHADRTPKQKVKIKTQNPRILKLFDGHSPEKELKMKSDKNRSELLKLLELITDLLQDPESFLATDLEGNETRSRGMLIKTVLTHMYQGLKVQIKPLKVDSETRTVTRVLLVCKWGGMLTCEGEIQAQRLGEFYRNQLIAKELPSKGENPEEISRFLRPEPNVSSNNERRVKRTAQLFAAGLIGLPLPVNAHDLNHHDCHTRQELDLSADVSLSFVRDDPETNHLLGDIGEAKKMIDEQKELLSQILHEPHLSSVKEHLLNCGVPSLEEMARDNHSDTNPLVFLLHDLYLYLKCVCSSLDNLIASGSEISPSRESLPMMQQRWKRLTEYFYHKKTKRFDTTKIPDVEDYVKHDAVHNRHVLGLNLLVPLFSRAKVLSDFVVPREYGLSSENKRLIGRLTCGALSDRIISNLETLMSDSKDSPVYLHFTSESHVHPLLNLLIHSDVVPMTTLDFFRELNYLTQVIFKVYEDTSRSPDDPDRFLIQLFYSNGVIGDVLACTPEDNRTLPVLAALCLHPGVTLTQLRQILSG